MRRVESGQVGVSFFGLEPFLEGGCREAQLSPPDQTGNGFGFPSGSGEVNQ